MNQKNRPKVGVGVIIIRDDKVLMGLRTGAHGEGTWCFPGGHLEYGETPEECGKREMVEETGLEGKQMDRVPIFTNDIFSFEDKHYITLFVVARKVIGEPRVMEPDKCERWEWFPWDQMPDNIFLPIENLKKTGYTPARV
jgi:8-oxo-dGTP diphosphatase